MKSKNKLATIIAIFGFTVTSLTTWFFYNINKKEVYHEYKKEVGEYKESIYSSMDIKLEVLYALSILFDDETKFKVSKIDFEVKKIMSRHEDIHDLAWIPKTQDENQISFPIKYISNKEHNKKLINYDLASNKNLLKSINKAINTGNAQATDGIDFIDKSKKGFLILLPIYLNNPITLEDRRKNFKGFVTGLYLYDEVFPSNELEDDLDEVQIKIIDATNEVVKTVVIHHPMQDEVLKKDMTYKKDLHETLGRHWVMIAAPSKESILKQIGTIPTIIFIVGSILTLFIVAYILIIDRRKRLKQTLENKINEEVLKNKEKTQQLIQQSKLAQTGEMISMIAHQWRQPLTAITSTANSISLQVQIHDKITNEELLEEIELITQYSQHLSSTIDDFRNFYKPSKEKESTTIEEVIEKTINIVSPSLIQHNIKLEHDFNCHKKIFIYSSQLSQVILNLFKNAEDILIEKQIKEPKIFIRTDFYDNKFILQIEDNAGGINEENLDKVFEPYFSTKEKKDGTGLGLYMSRTIIQEICKGEIKVENTQKGALFTITLERLDDEIK